VIRCRCADAAIAKGRELIVTDYDAERDVFNVMSSPLDTDLPRNNTERKPGR
jgi:hypothetical protein